MIAVLLAAISIAFPSNGRKLPNLSTCYMIGSASRGVTNLTIQGKQVEIFHTGAWSTMLKLDSGFNTIAIEANGEATNIALNVEAPKTAIAGVKDKIQTPRKWAKLSYASDVARSHPTNKAPAEITVVLDPGHGGTDSGALSPHGFYEKEANLLLAREMRAALIEKGFKVIMTRESDVAVELYERPKLAHTNNADLFISIHHNAPPLDKNPAVTRYFIVYVWNELGRRLADPIARNIGNAHDGEIPNNGVAFANYAVTRNPEIPSCLIETDFITSPAGELASWDHKRRKKIAAALADGVIEWLAPQEMPQETAESRIEKITVE